MTEAKKNDQDFRDKPPLALLPPEVLWEVGIVFGYGADKYDEDNWREFKPADIRRLLSGAMRHIALYLQGEYYDVGESESLHLVNSIAGLMMAVGTHMKYQDEIEGTVPTKTIRAAYQDALVDAIANKLDNELFNNRLGDEEEKQSRSVPSGEEWDARGGC